MSTIATPLPTNEANSSLAETSSTGPVPPFDDPENFRRSPGKKGYWFCIACRPSPHTGIHTYNSAMAIKHEQSQSHKNALKTSWEDNHIDSWGCNWAIDMGPYERLRFDTVRDEVPVKRRVRYWIRDMTRAEERESREDVEDEEEEGEEYPEDDGWEDWSSGKNDWGSMGDKVVSYKPWEECMPRKSRGHPVKRKRAPEEVDRRAVEDFKFVEKVARARGLSQETNRLHHFFRLPTEEKINRIHEIVQFISCH